MTLLFTSLFSATATPAPPVPDFVWTTNLLYRFTASEGVHNDDSETPAAHSDGVARWVNLGAAGDALQPDAARRPTYQTGGLAGRPYLACDRTLAQHFEDLAFTQPFGVTTLDPFTVFAVTDAVADLEQFPALLGSQATNGGKVGFYFREPAGAQIHWLKSQIRIGDITNPQLLMAAAGRNAAGTTASPYARFWLRQNRAGLWETTSQSSNLSSTAIAATQFLRSTGSSTGGYFHGHLYELLLYDGTLDDETTFAIEDWLAARYGLA